MAQLKPPETSNSGKISSSIHHSQPIHRFPHLSDQSEPNLKPINSNFDHALSQCYLTPQQLFSICKTTPNSINPLHEIQSQNHIPSTSTSDNHLDPSIESIECEMNSSVKVEPQVMIKDQSSDSSIALRHVNKRRQYERHSTTAVDPSNSSFELSHPPKKRGQSQPIESDKINLKPQPIELNNIDLIHLPIDLCADINHGYSHTRSKMIESIDLLSLSKEEEDGYLSNTMNCLAHSDSSTPNPSFDQVIIISEEEMDISLGQKHDLKTFKIIGKNQNMCLGKLKDYPTLYEHHLSQKRKLASNLIQSDSKSKSSSLSSSLSSHSNIQLGSNPLIKSKTKTLNKNSRKKHQPIFGENEALDSKSKAGQSSLVNHHLLNSSPSSILSIPFQPNTLPNIKNLVIDTRLNTQIGIESQLWTDKYCPKSLDDIAVHKKKFNLLAQILHSMLLFSRKNSLLSSSSLSDSRMNHATLDQPIKCLILNGPPGSGKSQSIELLLRQNLINQLYPMSQFNCKIIDYHNPVEFHYTPFDSFDPVISQNQSNITKPSIMDQKNLLGEYDNKLESLLQLLVRSKYPSLSIQGLSLSNNPPTINQVSSPFVDQVTLINDLPHLHTPMQINRFRNSILQYLAQIMYHPLIFILGDDHINNGPSQLLSIFSYDILNHPSVKIIGFNPISPTKIRKVLSKILESEGVKIHQDELKVLAESSQGDLRHAIHSLQFMLRSTDHSSHSIKLDSIKMASKKDPIRLNPSSHTHDLIESGSDPIVASSRKKSKLEPYYTRVAFCSYLAKDINLPLFHSVGKILYSKRLRKGDLDDGGSIVNDHLDHDIIPSSSPLYRSPMKPIPEKILNLNVSLDRANMFVLFLHENYIRFYHQIEEISSAANYLSISDTYQSNYHSKASMSEYSGLVAMRGLLFTNTGAKEHHYQSFAKPQSLQIHKTLRENSQIVKEMNIIEANQVAIFLDQRTIYTELIPYQSLIRKYRGSSTNYGSNACEFTKNAFFDAMSSYSSMNRSATMLAGGKDDDDENLVSLSKGSGTNYNAIIEKTMAGQATTKDQRCGQENQRMKNILLDMVQEHAMSRALYWSTELADLGELDDIEDTV